MYDTVGYARSRLTDTVIRHKGEPFHVVSVFSNRKKIRVVGFLLSNRQELDVPLEECDLTPVPLGYVNFGASSYYTMRMPMRNDWRQGLRYINLVDVNGRQFNGVGYETFVNTIKGEYPSFLQATEEVIEKESRAFHRDFAIKNDGTIVYKGQLDVANWDRDHGTFTIQKEWVRESLDEAIGA